MWNFKFDSIYNIETIYLNNSFNSLAENLPAP